MKIIDQFEEYMCAIIFLAMTALGFVNIVIRYLSNYSFASTQELLLSGFLLLTVFGAALAAKKGEHLAVTFFVDLLGVRWRIWVHIIADIISLVMILLAAYYCFDMVKNQYHSGVVSAGMEIPMWYYSVALPIGFILIACRIVQHAIINYRQHHNNQSQIHHV